jgi:hypothetical protein
MLPNRSPQTTCRSGVRFTACRKCYSPKYARDYLPADPLRHNSLANRRPLLSQLQRDSYHTCKDESGKGAHQTTPSSRDVAHQRHRRLDVEICNVCFQGFRERQRERVRSRRQANTPYPTLSTPHNHLHQQRAYCIPRRVRMRRHPQQQRAGGSRRRKKKSLEVTNHARWLDSALPYAASAHLAARCAR